MPASQERRPLTKSGIIPLRKTGLIGKGNANETVQVTVIVRAHPALVVWQWWRTLLPP